MPPDGETPLSDSEIQILKRWIGLGASDTLRLKHLEYTDPLTILIKEMMAPDAEKRWDILPKVADSTIVRLSSDYLTITRISAGSNALRVAMYKPPLYDPEIIIKLKALAENIVELDLSNLPLGSKETGMIAGCKNLEWLEINGTPVNDDDLDTLKVLSKLKLLKVYETNIGYRSLNLFGHFKDLEQLYLWKTSASDTAIAQLIKIKPDLKFYKGIDRELESYFIQSDSLLPEEKRK